jgi:hypothetical protein
MIPHSQFLSAVRSNGNLVYAFDSLSSIEVHSILPFDNVEPRLINPRLMGGNRRLNHRRRFGSGERPRFKVRPRLR